MYCDGGNEIYKFLLNGESPWSLIETGKYDYINSDITVKHFKSQSRCGEVEIKIFYLKGVTLRDAINMMNKTGYRAADLYEMVAFGARHPYIQCRFYPQGIVELGTVWHTSEDDYVVVLSSENRLGVRRRNLDLIRTTSWDRMGKGYGYVPRVFDGFFLAVKK